MRSLKSFMITISLSILFVGCAGNPAAENSTHRANMDAEKSGNPYRWHVKDVGGGASISQMMLIGTLGKTVADEQLQTDILIAIGNIEITKGGTTPPKLLEVRVISKIPNQVSEIWVISRGERRIAYVLNMKPSSNGGVDFGIQGPW